MNEKQTEDVCEELGEPRSIWKVISFNAITFGASTAFYAIQTYAFYFWEVEVLLPLIFVTAAIVIYGIWDAINDPLIGYLSDKPRKYTKRWGRRFPLIMIGYVPAAFFALFVFFLPPGVDPIANAIPLFIYLTVFLIIYELFSTTGQINHDALFPQIFRTDKDRLRSSTTSAILYVGTILFGTVIPPLFFIYGDPSSFLIGSVITLFISIPFLIIGIPGNREDDRMIQQVLDCEEERQKVNYIQSLIALGKNKNFIANIIYYIAIRVMPALGFGSILYFVRYNLGLDPGYAGLVSLGFLIGLMIGIAPWGFIAKKIGFYKTFLIVVAGLSVSMLMVVFIQSFELLMVTIIIAGSFVAGIEIADTPLAAYMVDDVVVKAGHRPEGVYYGIRNIIVRISTPITAISFAAVHFLTGFDAASDTQTPLALFGITVHFGLIPFIFGVVGLLAFIFLWDLKPDRMKEIWAKMKELDL